MISFKIMIILYNTCIASQQNAENRVVYTSLYLDLIFYTNTYDVNTMALNYRIILIIFLRNETPYNDYLLILFN